MEVTHYVLGFAFADRFADVLLIKKARPAWQAGFLNGIGGHIEKDECPHHAMTREFREETGLETEMSQWSWFANLKGPDWKVVCFHSALSYEFLGKRQSPTEEIPTLVQLKGIATDPRLLANLRWLLPMARNSATMKDQPVLEIVYP